MPTGCIVCQGSAPPLPVVRDTRHAESKADALLDRCSAARDVTPTLRAQGCRTYLFLEDGRMGRLSVTDAERLQVGPRNWPACETASIAVTVQPTLEGVSRLWHTSRSSMAAASDQCTYAAL